MQRWSYFGNRNDTFFQLKSPDRSCGTEAAPHRLCCACCAAFPRSLREREKKKHTHKKKTTLNKGHYHLFFSLHHSGCFAHATARRKVSVYFEGVTFILKRRNMVKSMIDMAHVFVQQQHARWVWPAEAHWGLINMLWLQPQAGASARVQDLDGNIVKEQKEKKRKTWFDWFLVFFFCILLFFSTSGSTFPLTLWALSNHRDQREGTASFRSWEGFDAFHRSFPQLLSLSPAAIFYLHPLGQFEANTPLIPALL